MGVALCPNFIKIRKIYKYYTKTKNSIGNYKKFSIIDNTSDKCIFGAYWSNLDPNLDSIQYQDFSKMSTMAAASNTGKLTGLEWLSLKYNNIQSTLAQFRPKLNNMYNGNGLSLFLKLK